MRVSVQFVTDATTARAMMAAIAVRMSAPMMQGFMQAAVVPYIQQRATDRFARQGDDVSGPWLPLAVATQQIRQQAGFQPAHPINVRTGQLRAFVTGSYGRVVSAGGMTDLEYPNPGNMMGILMRKLMVAQAGTPAPPTPARPVLGFNMNDTVALTAMVAGYLTV